MSVDDRDAERDCCVKYVMDRAEAEVFGVVVD